MNVRWNTIWAYYILLYGFIFDSVNASSHFNFKEKYWMRNVCLEDKNLTGALSLSASTSLLRCTSLCSSDKNCAAFNFDKKQQKCHGYSAIDSVTRRGNYASYIKRAFYNDVFKIHNEKKNFTDAMAICAEECRRLMILDSSNKSSYIINRKDFPKIYWVGATDMKEEKQWVWLDGRKFVPFVNELPIKFNNADTSRRGSERHNADCAVVDRTRPLLYDEHCSDVYRFVCETY